MDRTTFVVTFGSLFEHAPWVAEDAWEARPFADVTELEAALEGAMRAASPLRKLELVRAHPPLGSRAGAQALTPASASEQASAGLDRLVSRQDDELRRLTEAYEERFGFPLIVCVREHTPATIVEWARSRLDRPRAAELETALQEVVKIARLRLGDLVRGAQS